MRVKLRDRNEVEMPILGVTPGEYADWIDQYVPSIGDHMLYCNPDQSIALKESWSIHSVIGRVWEGREAVVIVLDDGQKIPSSHWERPTVN